MIVIIMTINMVIIRIKIRTNYSDGDDDHDQRRTHFDWVGGIQLNLPEYQTLSRIAQIQFDANSGRVFCSLASSALLHEI